jgi:SAM-dependent methyltransferase
MGERTAVRGSRPSRRYQYLLGDTPRERARLAFQAKLWDPISCQLFDRIGVGHGWKVLEVGPGQGSLHLELRRRVEAPVDVVERSPVFTTRLARLCRRDGLGADRVWQMDLIDAPLPRAEYDLIFLRWVFLFLPDPGAHVKKLVRALKPGGILAIQDYHRETLSMVPRPEEWTRFILADLAFFASQGGYASIAGYLPEMYRRAGLRVDDITVTVKTGHPGSAVWRWLSTYFLGVLDRYAKFPPFTRVDAKRLRKHWLAASREQTSLLIAPALLDVVGRKAGKLAMAVMIVIAAGSPMIAQGALPSGVVRVLFGAADRVRNSAGTETCRIAKPLSPPVTFERGVTEISYAVELEPKIVKAAAAQLTAPPGQGALTAIACNVFTLVPGGFSQTQLGHTVSRADKKPLASGAYKLRITVDGQTADVRFTVK